MRLGNYSSVLFAPGVIATTFLAGCIIVGTGSSGSDNGSDNSGGVGGGPTTSSGSGVGGEFEESSTSSGTTQCIGRNDVGTVLDCDKMNISPKNGASSICGPKQNEPPIGYDACKLAFDIYASGPATDLKNCLSHIGVENACTQSLVDTCVKDMYDHVCFDKIVEEDCAQIDTDCVAAGQGNIDRAQCQREVMPLNDAAAMTLTKCLNDERNKPSATCKAAYNTCYDNLLQ